ncbi:MAG: nicotinate (nicotinamide) nucleotide adenylyltransferase [Phycisphaerales bacterium]|nr:MAG: nicotinate (nicotinamide) nucleotide adenylyltransferase [Phycisphaerales bacterium]
MNKRKIALFGGTFDPVHLGHTTVAAEACRRAGAEKVVFIPAKRSPLKGFLPKASDADRFTMIAIAIADEEHLEVSDFELNKPAPSYTLETVKQFQESYGSETSIHWLVGADGIEDLVYWHRIVELIDACHLTTMYRAGCEPPSFSRFERLWGRRRIEKLQRNIVQTPLVDISSTEVRNRLAAGRDVIDMLHPAVAAYIREHGLYPAKKAKET